MSSYLTNKKARYWLGFSTFPKLYFYNKVVSKPQTSLIAPSHCQAYAKDSQSLADLNDRQPMPVIQEAQLEKLKMLNVFEPCTLQIGKIFWSKLCFCMFLDETLLSPICIWNFISFFDVYVTLKSIRFVNSVCKRTSFS